MLIKDLAQTIHAQGHIYHQNDVWDWASKNPRHRRSNCFQVLWQKTKTTV